MILQRKGIELIKSVTQTYHDMIAKLEAGIEHCTQHIQENNQKISDLDTDSQYHQMHIDQATNLIAHLKEGLDGGRTV